MKKFDKRLIIIFGLFITTIGIAIYFFTKDDETEITSIIEEDVSLTTANTNSNTETEKIFVHIVGEVLNPGIVILPKGSRIADAIQESGGVTSLADISKINLAYELKDGQKVYVPSIADEENVIYIENDAGENVIVQDNNSPNSSIININLATQAELENLPGVGASTAAKIIDYREKNGDFKKVEDIMNVSGIGEAKFNSIKDYITV